MPWQPSSAGGFIKLTHSCFFHPRKKDRARACTEGVTDVHRADEDEESEEEGDAPCDPDDDAKGDGGGASAPSGNCCRRSGKKDQAAAVAAVGRPNELAAATSSSMPFQSRGEKGRLRCSRPTSSGRSVKRTGIFGGFARRAIDLTFSASLRAFCSAGAGTYTMSARFM